MDLNVQRECCRVLEAAIVSNMLPSISFLHILSKFISKWLPESMGLTLSKVWKPSLQGQGWGRLVKAILDCFEILCIGLLQIITTIFRHFEGLWTIDHLLPVQDRFQILSGTSCRGEGKGKSNAPETDSLSLLFRSHSVPLLESRFTISRQGKRVSRARGQKYYFSILSPTIYIYLRIKFKLYGNNWIIIVW